MAIVREIRWDRQPVSPVVICYAQVVSAYTAFVQHYIFGLDAVKKAINLSACCARVTDIYALV